MSLKSKCKIGILLLATGACLAHPAITSAADLNDDSRAALQQLVAQNPAAAKANSAALAVLVFPNVVQAGFIIGAHGGEGILFVRGRVAGHYRTTAASYGLQAGVQKFGYALFLMNQKGVDWVKAAHGWSIGSAPSLVVVDKGVARTMNTQTLHSGIYAFTFDQQGLMAGLGIQGSRIKRLD